MSNGQFIVQNNSRDSGNACFDLNDNMKSGFPKFFELSKRDEADEVLFAEHKPHSVDGRAVLPHQLHLLLRVEMVAFLKGKYIYIYGFPNVHSKDL